MKIASFSESYKPYISGVTRSVEMLKIGLESLGHDVYLFVPKYPGFKDSEKNIFRIPSLPSRYPGFRIALPCPGFISNNNYDVIHSNSPFVLGYFSMRYAKKRGIPFVYSFHTLFNEYLHYIPVPKKISSYFLNKFIVKFCDNCSAIIAPNKKTGDHLKGLGVTARVEIIPSGINVEPVQKANGDAARKELGIPANIKVLVYVGRLSKEKNLPFLLKMLAEVLKKRNGVKLLLVGSGPFENALKTMAKDLGVAGNVIFAGQKSYPLVLDYYKCGDIFVFSSKTETQGLVIAEAKSCGLPVVAVNAGGISESVTDGQDGFLVEDDITSFVEKVVFLLEDDHARKEMSAKAIENAAAEFSRENIAKKTEILYNSLLKGSSSR